MEEKLVPPVICPYKYDCLCTRCNNKDCDLIDCENCVPGAEEDCAVLYCTDFIPFEKLNESDDSKR